jgi:2-methylisocitrate lyase-like PEP mutase family enzyme
MSAIASSGGASGNWGPSERYPDPSVQVLDPSFAKYLEAPENRAEMTRFCEAMQKPCMANMVPGAKTPVLPPKELQQIGYKLALYPVALLTSAIAAMQTALVALRPESGTSLPPSISFAELQKVVGFPDYWTQEAKYQVRE